MAFSDSRNERDRAETGRNSPNHGGGNARDAAQRNMNAMAARNAPRGLGFDPRMQPRRTANPSPSYEMSLHNLREVMGMMPLSPFGALRSLGGALGVPGLAPDFQGYTGNVMGPGDYDPSNRFAGQGLMLRMNQRAGRAGLPAAGRGLQRNY